MNLTKLKAKREAGISAHGMLIREGQQAEGSGQEKHLASGRARGKRRYAARAATGRCRRCNAEMPEARVAGGFVTCGCHKLPTTPVDDPRSAWVQDGQNNGQTPVENARDRRLRKTHNRRDPTGAKPKGVHAIAERRGTLCYVCGKPVDMRLAGTEPDGPTLEHIVPVRQWGAI